MRHLGVVLASQHVGRKQANKGLADASSVVFFDLGPDVEILFRDSPLLCAWPSQLERLYCQTFRIPRLSSLAIKELHGPSAKVVQHQERKKASNASREYEPLLLSRGFCHAVAIFAAKKFPVIDQARLGNFWLHAVECRVADDLETVYIVRLPSLRAPIKSDPCRSQFYYHSEKMVMFVRKENAEKEFNDCRGDMIKDVAAGLLGDQASECQGGGASNNLTVLQLFMQDVAGVSDKKRSLNLKKELDGWDPKDLEQVLRMALKDPLLSDELSAGGSEPDDGSDPDSGVSSSSSSKEDEDDSRTETLVESGLGAAVTPIDGADTCGKRRHHRGVACLWQSSRRHRTIHEDHDARAARAAG